MRSLCRPALLVAFVLSSISAALAQPAAPDPELEALRRAAEDTAGAPEPDEKGPPPARGSGNLSKLNPEVSATGDALALWVPEAPHVRGGDRSGFLFRELELNVRSNLDPYSLFNSFISFGPEGVDVEEVYIRWDALAAGLSLTAGRLRQSLAPINRWHAHARDQVDLPLVYRELIGEDGLAQTGVALEWLAPAMGPLTATLNLEVTNSENEMLFAGEAFALPAALARLGLNVALGRSGYLEVGFAGLHGYNHRVDPAGDPANPGGGALDEPRKATDLFSADFTAAYDPAGGPDRFRLFLRGQGLFVERETQATGHRTRGGAFTYLNLHLDRRFEVGVRGDLVTEEAGDLGGSLQHRTWGVTPYVTFWQSEFVRLRVQSQHIFPEHGDMESVVVLQLTGAVGPHRHERY